MVGALGPTRLRQLDGHLELRDHEADVVLDDRLLLEVARGLRRPVRRQQMVEGRSELPSLEEEKRQVIVRTREQWLVLDLRRELRRLARERQRRFIVALCLVAARED